MDFFQCQKISKNSLYPPRAIPCELYNIRPEAWKEETLDLFRQYLNDSTPQIKARVSEFSDAFKLTTIQVWVRGIGDLGEMLVVNGVAKWKNQPLEPTFTVRNDSLIGTCDMLFETGGWGDVVKIDVRAIETSSPVNEHFTCTSHFKTESMIDSINTAFIFTKSFLKDKNNLLLDNHSLHISAENREHFQHRYHGTSGGAIIALCMISECLQLKIPGHIAVTGQILGHGDIFRVGGIREKMIGASKYGKSLMFVPEGNLEEALETDVEGLTVTGVKNVKSIIETIWN